MYRTVLGSKFTGLATVQGGVDISFLGPLYRSIFQMTTFCCVFYCIQLFSPCMLCYIYHNTVLSSTAYESAMLSCTPGISPTLQGNHLHICKMKFPGVFFSELNKNICAGILEQSLGLGTEQEKGCRTALPEPVFTDQKSIPSLAGRNRFLGSLKFKNNVSGMKVNRFPSKIYIYAVVFCNS